MSFPITPAKPKTLAAAFRASLAVSLALLFLIAFQWTIVDWITPFLMVPALFGAWVLFAAVSVWAAWQLRRFRELGTRAAYPLLVCLAALLAALFVPFTRWGLQWDFHRHRADREAIVRRVLDGSLRPAGRPDVIALGEDAPQVSRGGNDILVEEHGGRKYVFFFTYRGVLDNYSGFLFVPDGGDPREFYDLGEPGTELVKYGGSWYWAGHR